LTLNDDGTFTQHVQNRVMWTLIMTSRGKYMRAGDTLTLTGTSAGYSDDGYVKEHFKDRAFTMKLKYADGVLTILDGRTDEGISRIVFRREGEHALPLPKVRPSDPKAVQIVHEMQRRYAALKSYSDEGTLTSSGRGFMAKNAIFQTRFVRPRRFRFQVVEFEDGKEWNKNVVWSDGEKAWWYSREMGGLEGGTVERGLGNALSTISPTAGEETMLVPALLLPTEFGGPSFDAALEEISFAGDEKVSGKDCFVIGLSNPEGMRQKLWIEKSDYQILQAFDSLPKATITYQPKCNLAIPDSEFKFSPPK
jgi:outer membrane lipoprotein-sorting protein